MDEKVNADLKSLQFILGKNKPYILPVAIILTCILLFFFFVIPQFNMFLKIQNDAKESSLKLDRLNKNLDILTNVDDSVLESQLTTLSSALPINKDFVSVLNSIYSTAQKTGVSIGSFSLQIGDVSKSQSSADLPVLQITLPINSGINAVNNFMKAISRSLPLAEVYSVKVSGTTSTVALSFYYKPLGVAGYSQDVPVSPISQKGINIISQLKGFDVVSSSLDAAVPVASSSATK